MKPMKFEFVVFGIAPENAMFLWNIITKVVELLGYDITGDVYEETEDDEEINEALSLAEADIDWSDPAVYYSNEDEHDDYYGSDEYLDTTN